MSLPVRYLVTGANKGIGYHITRLIARHHCTTLQKAVLFLGCRNAELGNAAVAALRHEFVVAGTEKNGRGIVEFQFVHLDLTQVETIAAAKAQVEGSCGGGGLHVLVNNAGMAFKGDAFSVRVAEETIGTNFRGTALVTEHFLPLLLETAAASNGMTPARVINVCSMAGLLKNRYSPQIRGRFLSAASVRDLLVLTKEFVEGVREGNFQEKGWPRQTYAVSKAAEIAFSRILAKQVAGNNVVVYPCCPGWCRTDMAGPRAAKSAEEGADTPAFLAVAGVQELPTSGSFVTERQVVRWEA